jgi:hypothetical protein
MLTAQNGTFFKNKINTVAEEEEILKHLKWKVQFFSGLVRR